MKFKLLETITINATVNTKFCISWSDDSKISVVAEDGVHVYELRPLVNEVLSTAIVHSWIPNNSASPFFNAVVNNRINNFLWKLNRNQLCRTIADSSMANCLKTCKSHVIQSAFSPLINGESYISCLSENGCLDIYRMDLNAWTPVINVAEEWIRHCMFQAESELDFENFKSKILMLKFVTCTWTEKPDVFFLTGHEDGRIVIWDVVCVEKSLRTIVKIHFQVFETPSALAMIILPHLSTFAVFVGVVTGRILTFSFDKKAVGAESDLWKEQDLVAPSLIQPVHDKSHLWVLTVKHNTILIHVLKALPKNLVNILKMKWFEFPALVVGLQRFQDRFVVALQSHDFYALEISDDTLSIKLKKMVSSPSSFKDETDVHCYGLTLSKNCALWITVSCKVFCTDKPARGVIRLQIFANYPVSYKSLSDVSASVLLEKIVSATDDVKLTQILDLLELKKFEFSEQQICSSYSEENNLTLSQLKLLLWEVKLKMSCYSTDLQAVVDHLKYRIATKYASEGLRQSSSKVNLQILLASLEEKNNKKSDLHLGECLVCKEPLFPQNFKMSSCPNSHRFPRCSISFLPCNNTPYALCRHCNSIALLEYVSDEGSRCLYCDGLLIADDRLRPTVIRDA